MDSSKLIAELAKYDYDTPKFSLDGLCTYSRVVDVLDGDTIVCVIPVLGSFFKFHVRLNGIDTCEMKSKSISIKSKALDARQAMLETLCGMYPHNVKNTKNTKNAENVQNTENTDNVENTENTENTVTKSQIKEFLRHTNVVCWLKCYKFDKYGRLLADVYKYVQDDTALGSTESMSDYLLKNKLAYSYDGGTKSSEF